MSEELNRAKLNLIHFFHALAQKKSTELLIKTSDYTIVGYLLTNPSVLTGKQRDFKETKERWIAGTELTEPYPVSIVLTDAVIYGLNSENGQSIDIIEIFLDKIDAISLKSYLS